MTDNVTLLEYINEKIYSCNIEADVILEETAAAQKNEDERLHQKCLIDLARCRGKLAEFTTLRRLIESGKITEIGIGIGK